MPAPMAGNNKIEGSNPMKTPNFLVNVGLYLFFDISEAESRPPTRMLAYSPMYAVTVIFPDVPAENPRMVAKYLGKYATSK